MTYIHWTLFFQAVCVLVVVAEPSSYAPTRGIQCPSNVTYVRKFSSSNQSLHPGETSYINSRLSAVSPAWKTWLGDASQLGYNFERFKTLPRLGISLSGGGGRAALYGAGVLEALDGRNTSSISAGTGGLLQTASYITGLSGGSWLTASLTFNNYPNIRSLVVGDSERPGWMLDIDLLVPGGLNVFNAENRQYYNAMLSGLIEKENMGFRTSVTDVWARFVSYHFLTQNHTTRDNFFTNATEHGAGILWSQIPGLEGYRNHSMPFPIVVTDSRPSLSHSAGLQTLDSPVFEISPYEMGSYDSSLSAMADITYLGTNFIDGQPVNNSDCVTGFDQAGFVIGTSSSPFNAVFDIARQRLSRMDPIPIVGLSLLTSHILSQAAEHRVDVANWPNPFKTSAPTAFNDYNSTWLDLVDGSENFANIPLGPLFLKTRNLDVIVAVEGSSDFEDNNFVNGTSLLSTATRLQFELSLTHRQFPPIPANVQDMNNTGVVFRPTFFGCYPTQDPPEWPLVIYLPNSPPLNGDNPVTNTNTFKTSYTAKHISIFLDQTRNLTISGFTPGSQDPDSNFGRCLQCAAIDRARYKQTPPISLSDFCSLCFERYCYDPEYPPSARDIVGRIFDYKDPDPQAITLFWEFLAARRSSLITGTAIFLLFFSVIVTFCCIRSNRRARKAWERALYDGARDEESYGLRDLSWLSIHRTVETDVPHRSPNRDTDAWRSGHIWARTSSDSLTGLLS